MGTAAQAAGLCREVITTFLKPISYYFDNIKFRPTFAAVFAGEICENACGCSDARHLNPSFHRWIIAAQGLPHRAILARYYLITTAKPRFRIVQASLGHVRSVLSTPNG